MTTQNNNGRAASPLVEGEDYYWEGTAMVFTKNFHRKRGYCCGSGCRHCPYKQDDRCQIVDVSKTKSFD